MPAQRNAHQATPFAQNSARVRVPSAPATETRKCYVSLSIVSSYPSYSGYRQDISSSFHALIPSSLPSFPPSLPPTRLIPSRASRSHPIPSPPLLPRSKTQDAQDGTGTPHSPPIYFASLSCLALKQPLTHGSRISAASSVCLGGCLSAAWALRGEGGRCLGANVWSSV